MIVYLENLKESQKTLFTINKMHFSKLVSCKTNIQKSEISLTTNNNMFHKKRRKDSIYSGYKKINAS